MSEGKLVRKPREMANLQMKYYVDKVDNLVRNWPVSQRNPHRYLDEAISTWESKDDIQTFSFREISLTETAKLIDTLGNSGAHGHDQLDAMGIKDTAGHLVKPLQFVINNSLMKGKFASKWKFLQLTPRLKSSELDKMSVKSYRPVAVLPTVSKIVERAAQGQLLKFLEDTKQLHPSNHTYRKDHSTMTTLLEIMDEVYQGTEEKKMTSMMTIDQSGAFDSVSHMLLLEKLHKYKVGPQALSWIKDYLQYRTQYVVIGSGQSVMKPVLRGVPQGSVIGPLLYAVFTTDMAQMVKLPSCSNQVHQDRTLLFGLQCSFCGVMSQYADDSTYVVNSKLRQENQTRIRRNIDELKLEREKPISQ